jgi:hypothetical protein
MKTALARAVGGAVLIVGLQAAGCPTAPVAPATFLVATIDGEPWTPGVTPAGPWSPSATLFRADSTLVIQGAGMTSQSTWYCTLMIRRTVHDSTQVALGDSGSAGAAVCGENTVPVFRSYRTVGTAPGTLIVTSFDTTSGFVTGRFAFTARDSAATRTILVSDGRFALRLLVR